MVVKRLVKYGLKQEKFFNLPTGGYFFLEAQICQQIQRNESKIWPYFVYGLSDTSSNRISSELFKKKYVQLTETWSSLPHSKRIWYRKDLLKSLNKQFIGCNISNQWRRIVSLKFAWPHKIPRGYPLNTSKFNWRSLTFKKLLSGIDLESFFLIFSNKKIL